MLVILLYFIFLFFLLMPLGVGLERVLKIKNTNTVITLLSGMILSTVLFSFALFFKNLGKEIFLIYFLLSTILGIVYRQDLYERLNYLKTTHKTWTWLYKILFLIVLILVLAKSSQFPFVIDNESYYLQTIKWFNHYPYTEGLANLHIYLAQSSSWHILQSGLNFWFITNRINDINGFLFLIYSFYLIDYLSTTNKLSWVNYLFLFNILLFQFIDAPSPDMPIFLLFQIIMMLYLEEDNQFDTSKIILLLITFLIFIKLTIAPVALLGLVILMKNKSLWGYLFTISIPMLILWMGKNSIISGYPLYPFPFLALEVDWLVPEEIRSFVSRTTENSGFFSGVSIKKYTYTEKMFSWLFQGGITGLLNIGMLILFLLIPFTRLFKIDRNVRVIYCVLLIHFIILVLTSPQFRFFLPEFIFFTTLIINDIVCRFSISERLQKFFLSLGVLLPVVLLFNLNLEDLTTNDYHRKSSGFSLNQIFIPNDVTKFPDVTYDTITKGNLIYYSPNEIDFYNTGNGPLPCVSKSLLDYFEYRFNFYPQLRTDNIKDGFYTYKIIENP